MSRDAIVVRDVWRSGPVTAVRYGKVVTVYLPSGSSLSGLVEGKDFSLGTLPAGWRPANTAVQASVD